MGKQIKMANAHERILIRQIKGSFGAVGISLETRDRYLSEVSQIRKADAGVRELSSGHSASVQAQRPGMCVSSTHIKDEYDGCICYPSSEVGDNGR